MHCMLVVQLLRKHGFGFLTSAPTSSSAARTSHPVQSIDRRGFRRVLYSSVLATDMSLHFAWIARLKDLGESLRDDQAFTAKRAQGEMDEEDRIMICQAIIKCADISNPVSRVFNPWGLELTTDTPTRRLAILVLCPPRRMGQTSFPGARSGSPDLSDCQCRCGLAGQGSDRVYRSVYSAALPSSLDSSPW